MTMRQMKWIDRRAGSLLCGVVAFFDALARRAGLASRSPQKGDEAIEKILITKYLGMGTKKHQNISEPIGTTRSLR